MLRLRDCTHECLRCFGRSIEYMCRDCHDSGRLNCDPIRDGSCDCYAMCSRCDSYQLTLIPTLNGVRQLCYTCGESEPVDLRDVTSKSLLAKIEALSRPLAPVPPVQFAFLSTFGVPGIERRLVVLTRYTDTGRPLFSTEKHDGLWSPALEAEASAAYAAEQAKQVPA